MDNTPPEQDGTGDPSTTPAGQPGPTTLPAVARPVSAPGPPDWQASPSWDQPEGPPPRGMSVYLHGFRRRWLLATTLGLVSGGLAGAAVLLTRHETYTATALVRVASQQQQLVFGTAQGEGQASFDVYKNTQIQLLKSRFCMIAALRDPEVAKLASNRAVNEEVLRLVAQNKEWTRAYPIKVALLNNPKCPVGIAMSFLPHLYIKDLKMLANNRNVSSVLFTMAKKRLKSKGPNR